MWTTGCMPPGSPDSTNGPPLVFFLVEACCAPRWSTTARTNCNQKVNHMPYANYNQVLADLQALGAAVTAHTNAANAAVSAANANTVAQAALSVAAATVATNLASLEADAESMANNPQG